jgi:hypothetical protein
MTRAFKATSVFTLRNYVKTFITFTTVSGQACRVFKASSVFKLHYYVITFVAAKDISCSLVIVHVCNVSLALASDDNTDVEIQILYI